MSDIRANMATLERAKEGFRHQLSEYKRDNERLTEKLALATNDKRELERKVDQLNAYITQLQQSQGAPSDRQSVSLQLLVDRLREENSSLRREKDELQEAARKWLDSPEGSVPRLKPSRAEKERSPLPHSDKGPSQSSTEDVSGGGAQRRNHTPSHAYISAKFSQGSVDEEGGASSIGNLGDIPTSDFSGSQGRSHLSGSGHSGSGHSFTANRKLSCSTNNLYGDNGSSQEGRGHHTKLSEQTNRLQGRDGSDKKLEELSQQRLDLLSQVCGSHLVCHIHTHTFSLSLSHTHIHTYTHTYTHSLSYTHTHTHTHSLTHTYTYTLHTHTHSLSHTHTHTHYTHTHTLSLSHTHMHRCRPSSSREGS